MSRLDPAYRSYTRPEKRSSVIMLTGYLRLGSVDESRLERVTLVWPPRHLLLATVLFTDIVDSAKQAAEIGDWKSGELLQQHQVIVRRELARFRGREVNTAGMVS
jgi:class 3 adenylate cyclase